MFNLSKNEDIPLLFGRNETNAFYTDCDVASAWKKITKESVVSFVTVLHYIIGILRKFKIISI